MTQGLRVLKLGAALLALPLTACETMNGWVDSMGEHMPVVGDRCEHWQCFTSGGQAQSDAIAAQKEKEREMQERINKGLPPEPAPAAGAASTPGAGASMSNAAQAQYQQYMQQQQEMEQQPDQSSFIAPGSDMSQPAAPAQPY